MEPQRLAHGADTIQVVAGGLATAILADLFTEVNLILLCLWAIAVVGDLFAGLWRVVVLEGWAGISGTKFARGLAKKVAFSFFILAGGLADALVALTPAVGATAVAFTPIFKAVLVALIVYEIGSITRNAKQATGAAIPAAIIMRTLDREQLGAEPPADRHYDRVALESERRLRYGERGDREDLTP